VAVVAAAVKTAVVAAAGGRAAAAAARGRGGGGGGGAAAAGAAAAASPSLHHSHPLSPSLISPRLSLSPPSLFISPPGSAPRLSKVMPRSQGFAIEHDSTATGDNGDGCKKSSERKSVAMLNVKNVAVYIQLPFLTRYCRQKCSFGFLQSQHESESCSRGTDVWTRRLGLHPCGPGFHRVCTQ
jgi:hypothetical protein